MPTVPVTAKAQPLDPVFSRSVYPDIEILDGNKLNQGIFFPLAFIEIKRPAFDIAAGFEGALSTSQRLNNMVSDKVKGSGSITALLLAVAQALFYSLHSVSRCVALCVFNSVIFLEIVFPKTLTVENSGDQRMKVRESKVYDRTDVVGLARV